MRCQRCGYEHLFPDICVSGKKKICLGSAEPPIHPQHLQIMNDYENWQLIDLYIDHPDVLKMDATKLEYPDNFLQHIYASHLLEHLPHPHLPVILKHWHTKLQKEGILTLNVPDLVWISNQILRYENNQILESDVYNEFYGERGLMDVVYGTHAHEGETHKAGFTKRSLEELLKMVGFRDIVIDCIYDAHDMGVLIATAKK